MKKIIILTLCVLGYTLGQAQFLTYDDKAKILLQRAENAYNNEFYELALEYYIEIEANPNISIYFNAQAYNIMGFCYDKLSNNNQAITCYQKAASLGDKDAQEYLKSKGYSW